MKHLSLRRRAAMMLAALALWATRPPSAAAGTVVLSDNITGVADGGTEAATGSTWLASSFGTDNATYQLDSVSLLLQNSVVGTAAVDIYTDGGQQPGTLVGALTETTSAPTGSVAETTFTAAGITLAADSTYWVVLSSSSGEFDWGWATSDSGTGVGFTDTWSQSPDGGGSWFTFVGPDSYPLQMIVTASTSISAVPEPGSPVLLGVGAGLVLFHLVRRKGRPPVVRGASPSPAR